MKQASDLCNLNLTWKESKSKRQRPRTIIYKNVYYYDRICACFFNQFQTFQRFCRFASQPTDTWYVVILNNSGTYWKVSVTTVLFSEYCFNSKLFSPRANWFLSVLPLEASAYICTRQLENSFLGIGSGLCTVKKTDKNWLVSTVNSKKLNVSRD